MEWGRGDTSHKGRTRERRDLIWNPNSQQTESGVSTSSSLSWWSFIRYASLIITHNFQKGRKMVEHRVSASNNKDEMFVWWWLLWFSCVRDSGRQHTSLLSFSLSIVWEKDELEGWERNWLDWLGVYGVWNGYGFVRFCSSLFTTFRRSAYLSVFFLLFNSSILQSILSWITCVFKCAKSERLCEMFADDDVYFLCCWWGWWCGVGGCIDDGDVNGDDDETLVRESVDRFRSSTVQLLHSFIGERILVNDLERDW